MKDERIASVYLWQNGQVMVFDVEGQQMPEYQDPSPQARERLKVAFPERLWHCGVWRSHVVTPQGEVRYWTQGLRSEGVVPDEPYIRPGTHL